MTTYRCVRSQIGGLGVFLGTEHFQHVSLMCLQFHVHVQTCQTGKFDNSTKSYANFLVRSFFWDTLYLLSQIEILGLYNETI